MFLKCAHLRRRGAFLRDENAAGETAVAHRKKRERQMGEEKQKADDTGEQDRDRQIGAIEKIIERTAVRTRSRA